MDLEKFIERATQSGKEDSKGSFTLGAEAARQKLLEYQQSAPERYLLMVVSAGIAFGAKAVNIQWDKFHFEVSFSESVVDAEHLRDGLGRVIAGEADTALLDLVLGLYGALSAGAHRVLVQGADRASAYLWTISSSGEAFERKGGVRKGLVICIEKEVITSLKKLARFVGKLRGFAGMCPEIRLVADLGEYSRVPINVNGVLVNRPIFLPSALCALRVGNLENVQEASLRTLRLDRQSWNAALALTPGKLTWVVLGVSYPGPQDLGLRGVVYCDHLRRDISREQVVQDANYRELIAELQECKSQMVVEALKEWTKAKALQRIFLVDELAELMRRDRVSVSATIETLEELERSPGEASSKLGLCRFWALEARLLGKHAVAAEVGKYGYRFCLMALNSEEASLETLQICIEMIEFSGDENLPYLEWLLLFCYLGVSEHAPGMDEWLLKANAEVVKRHGSSLRPKSYPLLLGLQACRTLWHSDMGYTHNAKLHLAYTKRMMRPPPSWTEEETGEGLRALAGSLLQYAFHCDHIRPIQFPELATPLTPGFGVTRQYRLGR